MVFSHGVVHGELMIFIGSDNTVSLTNLMAGSNVVSDAEVSGTLLSNGNSVYTFSFTALGSGNYMATLPADFTASMSENLYVIQVTAVSEYGTLVVSQNQTGSVYSG